jgi:hypothetical protein
MDICDLNWLWISLFRPFGCDLNWLWLSLFKPFGCGLNWLWLSLFRRLVVVLIDCGYHCLDPLVVVLSDCGYHCLDPLVVVLTDCGYYCLDPLVVVLTDCGYHYLDPLVYLLTKTLKYLTFQSSDYERTWWRLFHNRLVQFLGLRDTFCSISRTERYLLFNFQDWAIPVVQFPGLSDTCCSISRTEGYLLFTVQDWWIPVVQCSSLGIAVVCHTLCSIFWKLAGLSSEKHTRNTSWKKELIGYNFSMSKVAGRPFCTPIRFSSKLFYGCHMRSRHCLSFGSTWVHPWILVGFMLLQFSV